MEQADHKITKSSLSDAVFAQLKAMVLSEKWKSGEKIPPEQVLSKMFGVSRLTVRIAIEKLNALRILDTRVGDGTYVTDFDFPAYISEIDELMLSDATIINDVSAYRNALELCSIEQIIRHGTHEDLSLLFELCDKMESISVPADSDLDSATVLEAIDIYVSYDYQFHCTLCEFSGNQLLHYAYLMAKGPIMRYLTLIVNKRLREYLRDHPMAETINFEMFYDISLGQQLHRSIMNAIQNKDLELCQMIHRRMHNYSIDSGELVPFNK